MRFGGEKDLLSAHGNICSYFSPLSMQQKVSFIVQQSSVLLNFFVVFFFFFKWKVSQNIESCA